MTADGTDERDFAESMPPAPIGYQLPVRAVVAAALSLGVALYEVSLRLLYSSKQQCFEEGCHLYGQSECRLPAQVEAVGWLADVGGYAHGLVGCAPETKKRVGFILPQPDFVFLGGARRAPAN
ncbi:MAG: hypothetical protein ACJAYU_003750 [Bradymonadia bacterium]|jgi:hypothetical protein